MALPSALLLFTLAFKAPKDVTITINGEVVSTDQPPVINGFKLVIGAINPRKELAEAGSFFVHQIFGQSNSRGFPRLS